MSKDAHPQDQAPLSGLDMSNGQGTRRITVSYGALSCTLEGYENPRETVEAIALFFRDLPGKERLLAASPRHATLTKQAVQVPTTDDMQDPGVLAYEKALRSSTTETVDAGVMADQAEPADAKEGAIAPRPPHTMGETQAPPSEHTAPAPNPKPHRPASDAPAASEARSSQAEPGDDDVTRLMSKVATELEDPRGASRRLSLMRLRRAVAARQGDGQLNPTVSRDARQRAFRADLQEAVQPRSPARAKTAPPETRPDARPLQLERAQRVDAPPPETDPAIDRESDPQSAISQPDFSAFIAETEARSVADLVEATASFLHHVSKEEGFSRRQVMSKVRAIAGPRFSPDQALLAFGSLVQTGKIRECGPALFTASEHIRFRQNEAQVG